MMSGTKYREPPRCCQEDSFTKISYIGYFCYAHNYLFYRTTKKEKKFIARENIIEFFKLKRADGLRRMSRGKPPKEFSMSPFRDNSQAAPELLAGWNGCNLKKWIRPEKRLHCIRPNPELLRFG